jgi:hypothetical protein
VNDIITILTISLTMNEQEQEQEQGSVSSITSLDSKQRRITVVGKMKKKLRKLEAALNTQRSQRRLRRGSASANSRASSLPTLISPIPEMEEEQDWMSTGTTSLSEDCDCSSITSHDDYLYSVDDDDDVDMNVDSPAGIAGSGSEMVRVVTPERGHRYKGVKSASEQSTIVVYRQPESFPEAVFCWMDSVEALVRSDEMANVAGSTCHLVLSAGNLAIKTCFLPVTIPLHIACATTDLVLGSCAHVVEGVAGALLGLDFKEQVEEAVEEKQHKNPIHEMVDKVFGFPGFFLGVAGKIKDDLGSVVISVVAPALGMQPDDGDSSLKYCDSLKYSTSCSGMSGDSEDFFDRLRLDYAKPPLFPTNKTMQLVQSRKTSSAMSKSSSISSTPVSVAETEVRSESSMYLLRVDDLGVTSGKQPVPSSIFYIDLQPKHSDTQELLQSMQRLVACGLGLMANHPPVRMAKHYESTAELEWNPEGSSKKLLRKMANMKSVERLQVLEKDHLIWSGECKKPNALFSSDYSFFLARGIIRRSPREFLNLLWDNERTCEYNNFCLGRNTVLAIDDKILSDPNAREGTKVIESETRVPFTGKSVKVTCIMHVRPLEAPDQGFVIVSRSLDSGMAGTHIGSRDMVKTGRKNEIIWGVNVLRCVPNNPQLTDLTSLSQVGSPMVPKFLAQRIGVMGVEDFYKNIRQPKVVKALDRPKALGRAETC